MPRRATLSAAQIGPDTQVVPAGLKRTVRRSAVRGGVAVLHPAIRMIDDDVAPLANVLHVADRVDFQRIPQLLLTIGEEKSFPVSGWPDFSNGHHANSSLAKVPVTVS
jgi:hypothetical protein